MKGVQKAWGRGRMEGGDGFGRVHSIGVGGRSHEGGK